MTQPPEHVTLTSEEGEALIDRVYASNLPLWLLLVIQEVKLSLKRFRQILFGEPTKGRSASVSSAPSTEAEKGEHNASPVR